MIFYKYIVSWKEGKELIKEFGIKYKDYKNKVPIYVPRLIKKVFQIHKIKRNLEFIIIIIK